MTSLDDIAVIVGPDETIDVTILKMAARSKKVAHAGIAVVLDSQQHVLGILTDGDLRRAYASGKGLDQAVMDVMVRDPISVPITLPLEEVVPEVYRRVRRIGRLTSAAVRHVLVTTEEGRFAGIYDFLQLLADADYRSASVAVIGMGYVGLTLAAALANCGHDVNGIDRQEELVDVLKAGKPHVHEPGLSDMLSINVQRGSLRFAASIDGRQHGVYIVTVGTPLDEEGQPNLEALEAVADAIASAVRLGNLIMLRSTVPVGTTRKYFIPRVEKLSGLRAGQDFHVAFAPERTVEGNALNELRTLPQVVGGLTVRCTRRAAEFWATLTPSIVRLPSLEAAEIVKLANNTFRDVSFAFANEVALLADSENLNAFEVIRAANEGYPRNPIPLPSPGVGGYCLTKDPILLSAPAGNAGYRPELGRIGRFVNEKAGGYPIEVLQRYAARRNRKVSELKVLLVGIAFKGEPETSDLRHSVAVQIGHTLAGMNVQVQVWDAVASHNSLRAIGLEPVASLVGAAEQADAILILNNHRNNVPAGILASNGKAGKLIFDGWSLLDGREIERIPGYVYATMGYMTPEA